jgi:hypothetical protein
MKSLAWTVHIGQCPPKCPPMGIKRGLRGELGSSLQHAESRARACMSCACIALGYKVPWKSLEIIFEEKIAKNLSPSRRAQILVNFWPNITLKEQTETSMEAL